MKHQEPFPVGKVEYLGMYPLCFEEFLAAVHPKLRSYYEKIQMPMREKIDDFYHNALLEHYYLYQAI